MTELDAVRRLLSGASTDRTPEDQASADQPPQDQPSQDQLSQDQPPQGTGGGLLFVGDPGSGKTTLLDRAAHLAAGGTAVLQCRGTLAESRLPYSGLHELLWPHTTELHRLPPAGRAALECALGIETGRAERYPVATALFQLLHLLAQDRPVLLLVDDLQWLDSDSCDALLFALRRLHKHPVAAVLTARPGMRHLGDRAGLRQYVLPPLTDAQSREVVAHHLPAADPATVERVLRTARGNPLALVETVRTVAASSSTGPLPVGQAFSHEVRQLSAPAQGMLLLAAAGQHESLEVLLEAAALLDLDVRGLDEAFTAGVLRFDRGRTEFRHPLLQQTVYEEAGPVRRMLTHRALAEVTTAERRTWHRAAVLTDPDDDVAAALQEQAGQCLERGAPHAALQALVRAAELSTEPADRTVRLAKAAHAAWLAGDVRQVRELLSRVDPAVAAPPVRGRMLALHGLTEFFGGSAARAARLAVEAARLLAPTDPEYTCGALHLAVRALWSQGDFAGIAALAQDLPALAGHADLAAELHQRIRLSLDSVPTPASHDDWPRSRLRRPPHDTGLDLGPVPSHHAVSTDTEDLAADAYVHKAGQLRRSGASLAQLPEVLTDLAATEILSGQWGRADAHLRESVQLAREHDLVALQGAGEIGLGWLAALHGAEQDARRHVSTGLRLLSPHPRAFMTALAHTALALLELGLGRPSQALDHWLPVIAEQGPAAHPPTAALVAADVAEAAALAGRVEEVRAFCTAYAAGADRTGPDTGTARATAHRIRALLADDREAALPHLALAVRAEATRTPHRPFNLARAHLLHGECLRRLRRRSQARTALEAARTIFASLGATPWQARAERELAHDRPSSPARLGLTHQEWRISRHAARGHTNKEIAARLHLSPRTVGYHLSNAYAKLAVPDRTQLRHIPALLAPEP
ncbi:transcriptional regulator [Streptomyces spiroverticillatus]|uniref:Transcriptional regulator n=1 Tax=Streptomyces finlayi TaxID=67296 RepID=A0A919CBC1_9ACTN|nr:AAA family ATPase [Streptomyces finlayi]GHA17120.1 transcriptional regulator [Streptomyces spiroverticillatus]GHC99135.1 transcriptional regulator [Streptomyces finlayi]